jgi:hypothetical protein
VRTLSRAQFRPGEKSNVKPATIADIRRHLREIATDLYARSGRARNPERARKLGRAADIATELHAVDLWERNLSEPAA